MYEPTTAGVGGGVVGVRWCTHPPGGHHWRLCGGAVRRRDGAPRLHARCSGPWYLVRSLSSCPRSHGAVGGMGCLHRAQVAWPASTMGFHRARSLSCPVPYPRSVVFASFRSIGFLGGAVAVTAVVGVLVVEGGGATVAVAVGHAVAATPATPAHRVPCRGCSPARTMRVVAGQPSPRR